MEKIFKYEEFTANSGETLFIECYGFKPTFAKFWRYGLIIEREGEKYSYVWGNMLLSRPNKKRLIQNY